MRLWERFSESVVAIRQTYKLRLHPLYGGLHSDHILLEPGHVGLNLLKGCCDGLQRYWGWTNIKAPAWGGHQRNPPQNLKRH